MVFGGKGWEHVPIHQAVRASAALAPFYAPSQILGRYYVDGGYSRTTNMRVAVQYGATLVLLVDPLVPMEAESAGHVAARGAIYGAMQGLKSLIHSRFDKATITMIMPAALPEKMEYSLKGKVTKTVEFKNYIPFGKIQRAQLISVKNLTNNRGTEVQFSDMKVNAGVTAADFTQGALKNE